MQIPGKNPCIYISAYLLASIFTFSAASAYYDVQEDEWYYEAVTCLSERGLMDGFPDGSFYPGMRITAAEFLKLICLSSWPEDVDPEDEWDDYWGTKYYKAALDMGALSATDISENQLVQRINRYNAALIISNVLDRVLDEDVTVPDGIGECIKDHGEIPAYYKSHVQRVYAAGIMGGYEDGSFKGKAGITRAEAAQMVLRLIEKEERLKPDLAELPVKVEDNWFGDAMFIGDSLTHGLSLFGGLNTPDYYYSTGVSLYSINSTEFETPSGTECSISDAFSSRKYGKVYIMLGINQVGSNEDKFYKDYSGLVDKVKEYQPDAEIYLQSILPVSKSKGTTSTSFTKENIEAYNEIIARIAQEKEVRYVDINSALADEEGYLPESATWDGVHLNSPYYKVWADYLRTHT